ALCEALDAGGPYGAGWPAPRVAAGPVRIVRADVVGSGHLRLVAAGEDGRRIKAIGFRLAEGPLGREMLAAPPHRRLWLAGRIRRDDWGDRTAAELHLEDAAWLD
nr:single-stranded-DNA-specific exonuclease RecJ [Pseudomonadota bacterium]